MPLTPQLIEAYENALYEVQGGPVLRIGERNAALERLLDVHRVTTAAFVTAANPRGRERSRAENDAAMVALKSELAWPSLPGEGRDPAGRWGAEPSVLLLGITRAEALALGRRLEQNAIAFCERGAAPELVLARPMRLVLDTQVWLDWLVFDDPSVRALRAALDAGRAEVLIDAACLAELQRVLGYPLGRRRVDADACLAACRKAATTVEAGTGTPATGTPSALPQCRDPDDQKFLMLAAGTGADGLVTRDRELLRLSRKCAPWLAIVPPQAFAQLPVK
jgi:putative PIN family toxin of toxin-antitoxin system